MQNISTNDLDLVTGGTPASTTNNGGSSGSSTAASGCSDQLLTGLQGIQSSIKDLGKNQNQGLFGGQNGLLFMTMALAMRQRTDVTVCSGGRCGGGYYSYRTGW